MKKDFVKNVQMKYLRMDRIMIVIIYKDGEVFFRFEDLDSDEENFISSQYSTEGFTTKTFDNDTLEEIG